MVEGDGFSVSKVTNKSLGISPSKIAQFQNLVGFACYLSLPSNLQLLQLGKSWQKGADAIR